MISDKNKTKELLLQELKETRKKIAAFETSGTNHKRAEEALIDNEAKLAKQFAELDQIYKTSPVGLCFMDTDLRYVRINEVMASINGKSISEHIGHTLKEVIPQIAPQVEPIYRKVIKSGKPALNFEVHGKTQVEPDVERDWLVSYYPVTSKAGAILGVSTVVQDITEQKRIEEALRRSEEFHRLTLINMSDAVFITDYKRKFLYICPNVDIIFGHSHDDVKKMGNITRLLGRKIIDINDLEASGEIKNIEHTITDNVGNKHDLLINVKKVSILGGSVLYTCRDITERKRAEQKLSTQAMIIDQIHDSVVSTDLEGFVTSWNKGAERLFGYTSNEMAGKHIATVYPEEEHAFLKNEIITPLQAEGKREVEVRMRRKSGEDFYAHLSLSMLHDEHGNARGMIGYSMDITKRKEAEVALQESENKYKTLLDNLQQKIFLKDKKSVYLSCNENYAKRFKDHA